MIGCRGHSADAVESSRQAGNSSLEVSVAVTWVIDALEKFEDSWIGEGGGIQRLNLLDGDVSVSNDPTALESLGSGIIALRGVWSVED